jgi:class 3 adenylate cyclase
VVSGEAISRRLAAILAADVAGYSRLMEADEEGTLARLKGLRRDLIDPKITLWKGRIVKTTGDGMLVEFASVLDAVRCAVEIQDAVAERHAEIAAGERFEWRIGINLGDVIAEGDDIYGDGVNLAARLEALAEPGPSSYRTPSTTRSATGCRSHSTISARSGSRTSPGRCGSIGCGRPGRQAPLLLRPRPCPTNHRSRSCPSPI